MVTLSWGAARPAFIGGALAGFVLARTWEGAGAALQVERLAIPAAVSALIAAGVVVWNFWDIRAHTVFLSPRPVSVLTADLRDVASTLRGIRTDPATAAYLAAVASCLTQYPARWVAIVPEDALSPVVFALHNPLPMDWLWPPEYYGKDQRRRIVEAADRLGRSGEYLVLEPIIRQSSLTSVPPPSLPTATVNDRPPPFPFDATLGAQIFAPLKAQHIACGPFVGRYEPRRLH
jgi:hypothetical protein